jgi:hypothetical protein
MSRAPTFVVAFLGVALGCGSESTGSNGAGGHAGGNDGGAGSGGASATATSTGGGGTAGSGGAGGAGGGVACGTGFCTAGQICCPGCEPGTGACYVGGCPGSACPPPSDASNDGPGACQGITCGPNDVCVHPTCGGGVPFCQPVDDAGMCPPGWQHQPICSQAGSAGPGCSPPPCQPPAPFCAPKPAACGSTVTCNCLPFDICASEAGFGGQCAFISGSRDVTCLSASARP